MLGYITKLKSDVKIWMEIGVGNSSRCNNITVRFPKMKKGTVYFGCLVKRFSESVDYNVRKKLKMLMKLFSQYFLKATCLKIMMRHLKFIQRITMLQIFRHAGLFSLNKFVEVYIHINLNGSCGKWLRGIIRGL